MLHRIKAIHPSAFLVFSLTSLLSGSVVLAQKPALVENRTAERIDKFSATLLGKAFVDGPLGEGAEGLFDEDPLINFLGFDCTTYVETVLALAISKENDPNDVLTNLTKIRYRNSVVDFYTRNHFIDADWIPNNKWLLTDVTQKLGGQEEVAIAEALINKPGWYSKFTTKRLNRKNLSEAELGLLVEKLHRGGSSEESKNVAIPYVKLSAIFDESGTVINEKILDRMPEASVVNIVRPNWNLSEVIGTNMNVSHQGIVIRKSDGKLYLRHASSAGDKVVSEILLVDYLKPFLKSPTIKGFNVLAIRE